MSNPLRECCDCGHLHKESECDDVRNYDYGVSIPVYDKVCPKCKCREYYPAEESTERWDMTKQYTCGHCENLRVGGNKRMPIPFCALNDAIVPHQWNGENFRFWRVPVSCGSDDRAMVKSESMASEKHHVIKYFDDIKPAEESTER